jgi:hypothetical protein
VQCRDANGTWIKSCAQTSAHSNKTLHGFIDYTLFSRKQMMTFIAQAVAENPYLLSTSELAVKRPGTRKWQDLTASYVILLRVQGRSSYISCLERLLQTVPHEETELSERPPTDLSPRLPRPDRVSMSFDKELTSLRPTLPETANQTVNDLCDEYEINPFASSCMTLDKMRHLAPQVYQKCENSLNGAPIFSPTQ